MPGRSLQENHELWDAVFAALGDAVSIQDRNFRILYQNPAHKKLAGDQLGRICYEVYDSQGKICDGCPVALTFADGAVHTMEKDASGRRASPLFVEITTSPLKNSEGEIVACIEMVRNVTRRRQSEQAIHSLVEGTARVTGEDFFRALVKNLALALGFRHAIICEITGRDSDRLSTLAVWSGEGFGENFEYPFAGTPCEEAVRNRTPVSRSQGIRNEFPGSRVLAAIGAEAYLCTPMFGSGNELLGLLTVIDDQPREITPRQMDVISIFAARAGGELERIRSEEERERLTRQLVHARKLESVGKLAGGIAHDFNNLLSTIIGYGELALMKTPDGSPVKDYVQFIMEAGEKAAGLTRQLLAFSRKQVLEMKVIDLNAVIENMVKLLRRMIGEDVILDMHSCGAEFPVLADPGQIEQIIMNLAVNARDAMPKGGILTVETAFIEVDSEFANVHDWLSPGSYARLAVTDTGHGIPAELQEKIFEPFFTTKESGKGTGLGLATVYGIVRQHNGAIFVYSSPDNGTSFHIYLPITSNASQAEPITCSNGLRMGRETVLVLDDDVSIRRLITDILEPLGYDVINAENGAEAMRIIGAAPESIDLIITDMVMPGMKGDEVVSRARKIRPAMRIILMSGYMDDSVPLWEADALEPVFMQKPVTAGKLSDKLKEALGS